MSLLRPGVIKQHKPNHANLGMCDVVVLDIVIVMPDAIHATWDIKAWWK